MFFTSAFLAGSTFYFGAKAYQRLRGKKKTLGAFLAKEHTGSRTLKRDRDSFLSDVRRQQMQQLASLWTAEGVNQAERDVNRYLATSSVAIGMATAGALLYSPLLLLSVPFIAYASLDIFQEAYRAIVKERRLRASVLHSLSALGMLLARYYFVLALATWLYHLGTKLLLKTQDLSRKNLINIFGEQPRVVWMLRDGVEIQVPFEGLCVGDVVVVNAGETIPIDGHITAGVASIDQRLLTGEAQPAEKGVGDSVFAATMVLAGRIVIEVEKAGADTVAANIGDILNRTADFTSSVEAKGHAISDRSVLPTLGLGAVTLSTLGPASAIAIVTANFSDVLRVIAPLGMLSFLKRASQMGLLIKDGRALELLNQVDTVVFDKTGTLTLEQPHVGTIYPCDGMDEDILLTYAAAAEYRQTHPIARAIHQEADRRGLRVPAIDEVAYEVGYGLKVTMGGQRLRVGSARFMGLEGIAIPHPIEEQQEHCHTQGYSLVFVAIDEKLGGMIELCPVIRPEAQRIIRQLGQRKLSVVIISGDQETPTRQLAQTLGIDRYFAEVLPEDKAALVAQLQHEGRSVCFVGDGINDAIALKKAEVAISLSGASSVATDTAQIVLLDGSLEQLDGTFDLAHDFATNLKTSLAVTLGPTLVCTSGILLLHFGIVSTIIAYYLSLGAGITNALLPAIRQKHETEKGE